MGTEEQKEKKDKDENAFVTFISPLNKIWKVPYKFVGKVIKKTAKGATKMEVKINHLFLKKLAKLNIFVKQDEEVNMKKEE